MNGDIVDEGSMERDSLAQTNARNTKAFLDRILDLRKLLER